MVGRVDMAVVAVLVLVFVSSVVSAANEQKTCSGIVPMKQRKANVSVTDFGAVGDGKTLNTKAFRDAVSKIKTLNNPDGTTLYVPPGVFLTGTFNLTSHMTLFLAKGAVIRATKDVDSWPLVAPLPSYGRGRELPPKERYSCLIVGDGLDDVIVTGENGTIDGQGSMWWNMWRQKALKFSRPGLLELRNTKNILITNVVFRDAPFWNIHPVYSSNIVVRNVTVLAPRDSVNTDGVDVDSCDNVCIEDCYMNTGDDLVAVKSGWDQYGIAYGRPSTNIIVRRLSGSNPYAGVGIGSEASGGIWNVLVEHMNLFDVAHAVHIKTNVGRGGVIRNITFSDFYVQNADKAIKISANVGDHPDDKFDPKALPVIKGVTFKDFRGVGIVQAGLVQGLKESPISGICLNNINFQVTSAAKTPIWQCDLVAGASVQVSPSPCPELNVASQRGSCAF